LNMDQTAIYFESRSNCSVAKNGANNVPTKGNSSDSKRCTVVVTIAADGTKLLPFFIFKGVPGGPLERGIPLLNVKGCCQRNGWFDELDSRKWVQAIVEPYVRDEENAFLLLDQYRVHFLQSFVNACNNIGMQQHWRGT
jgi:DDE superfamily endonuclease